MEKFFLAIVLVIGFLLRILFLNSYPSGFTPDEASFGYDAYSILKTGRDQWGHTFPLVLESFGDFKPPLYSYLAIPSVLIFGLNKFAVRLPNALLGSLSIFIVYLLVKNLRENLKLKIANKNLTYELLASLLLAISPWHVMLSRGAFEANLTTFFLPLGILLFVKGLKKKNLFLWSAVVFGLNLFTYHSAKFVTIGVLFFLIFIYRKEFLGLGFKRLFIFSVLFLVFFLPFLYTFFVGATARISDLTITKGALESASQERFIGEYEGLPGFISRLLHNKFQVFLRRFVSNYFQYFSPQFLFTNGPAESTYGMLRERGVLYWFELPFLVGFFMFLFTKSLKDIKHLLPIIFWLAIAPIPASLAAGPGYAANRAEVSLPAYQIIFSFGAFEIFYRLKSLLKSYIFRYIRIFYILFSLIIFLAFLEDYFIQSPYKISKAMLYGSYEAALWLKENTTDNQIILVSKSLSEPHIFIAFASNLDPRIYQEEAKTWNYKEKGLIWVDQLPAYRLGNYLFKNIDYEVDFKQNALLVGKPEEFPKSAKRLATLYYPSGEEAILIVEGTWESYAQKLN